MMMQSATYQQSSIPLVEMQALAQQRDISEVLLMCLLSLLKAKEITSESFHASFRSESQGKGSAKGKGKGKPGK